MSNIFFFSIPAWGHTNPTIPVVEELVKRGQYVRYYSFGQFQEVIEQTGADFVNCDAYLPELKEGEMNKLKKVSTTQMTITDLEITVRMDAMLSADVVSLKPDCIVSDSVCFWGKLIAKKFQLPFVCSTTTFAFNRYSSKYMQNSLRELADLIFGMPKVNKALKKLEPLGYHIDNIMSIVQNDNDTNTIVYTSELFQPYAETFSNRYVFVGPSVKVQSRGAKAVQDVDAQAGQEKTFEIQQNSLGDTPQETVAEAKTDEAKSGLDVEMEASRIIGKKKRKQIYISMGTVLNDNVHFYGNCIQALKDIDADVVISVGNSVDIKQFKDLPANVKLFPHVEQLEVLKNTDVFLTHCGMNSISESLYMGVPVVMHPQTGEQKAVAKRTFEMGAGIYLAKDTAEGIREAMEQVLAEAHYRTAAEKMKANFRKCSGASSAADFIEKTMNL